MIFGSDASLGDFAEAYDRYRIGYASDVYEAIVRYGIAPHARALDVGCGTGIATLAFLALGCDVVGLDPSPSMLAIARARAPFATFVSGVAEALPFAPDTFDTTICAQAFHWVDGPRAFAEFVRVTKPGGTIAGWWKTLMRGDTTRLARDAAALELGLVPRNGGPTDDMLALAEATLDDVVLRVVPWVATMRVADYLGYERTIAHERDAYGDRLDEFIDTLERRLGAPDAWLALTYVHHLYRGRVPKRAADAGVDAARSRQSPVPASPGVT